jgi:two-component system, chemotaxis family, sensor kinase CheA
MDELVVEFINETMEAILEIDADLVRLEKNPQDQELLGKIFRLMHTIKGTCGFIGLGRLEHMAHSAENLLDKFRSGEMTITEHAMTLLFMSIDRVKFLVSEISTKGKEPSGSDSDVILLIDEHISSPTDTAIEIIQTVQDQATSKEITEIVANTNEKPSEYLRVQVNVLEDLINMVSELVLTRNQLLQLVRMEENISLNTPLQRLNRIVSDLQDNVMKTRMQPIGNAWTKLPRIVRDLSNELKKKITLEMHGEDTELDRQVLELIKDPLIHMIRNSCDHGIEPPAVRTQKGKKEQGTIKLSSYHEGGYVVIKITDDGHGLCVDRIAQKALEKGLVENDVLQNLNEKQIFNFIMQPGFSTVETISNISGRGVGMDVVRTNIEHIGGSIDVDSKLGKGTAFTIQIPLTLAIISALIVEINKCRYAIPQMNIQELVSLDQSSREKIEHVNGKSVLRLRDRIISVLNSEMLFDEESTSQGNDNKLIAVLSSGSSYYGIVLDQIHDTEEVVIKSVSSVLKKSGIYSGNTILGDGHVIMILDPAAIARKFNIQKDQNQLNADQYEDKKSVLALEKASMLVVKAGNGAHKAIPLELVSRLQLFDSKQLTHSSDKLIVQFNDKLIQLNYIDPVNQSLHEEQITTLILSDDRSESAMGLVIDEVIDIIEGNLDISLSTARHGILGSMILGDYNVDVIDVAHFLGQNQSNWFSSQVHSSASYVPIHLQNIKDIVPISNDMMPFNENSKMVNRSSLQRVLIVDDSNFFRVMLCNILKASGYHVTLAEDAHSAIKMHDEGMNFDVILSDIEMPGMDGFEFVEKMKFDSSWKEIPFIAITSHNTPKDIEYGYKKGFNQYIGKFNKDELIRALSAAIQ